MATHNIAVPTIDVKKLLNLKSNEKEYNLTSTPDAEKPNAAH